MNQPVGAVHGGGQGAAVVIFIVIALTPICQLTTWSNSAEHAMTVRQGMRAGRISV